MQPFKGKWTKLWKRRFTAVGLANSRWGVQAKNHNSKHETDQLTTRLAFGKIPTLSLPYTHCAGAGWQGWKGWQDWHQHNPLWGGTKICGLQTFQHRQPASNMPEKTPGSPRYRHRCRYLRLHFATTHFGLRHFRKSRIQWFLRLQNGCCCRTVFRAIDGQVNITQVCLFCVSLYVSKCK